MKQFFKKLLNHQKKQISDSMIDKARESQVLLQNAAIDTTILANDVTIILQGKLNDYVTQIESISKILSDALILVTDEGIIESFNPAAEIIFGWKSKEIIGKHIKFLFKLDNSTGNDYLKLLDDICSENFEYMGDPQFADYEDFYGLHKSQRHIYIDVTGNKLRKSDNTIYYLILVHDVTKRVENEKKLSALAKRNDQLAEAVNASQTGIIITDPTLENNPIIFANKGFCEMTGYRKEEVLGEKLHFLDNTEMTEGHKKIYQGIESGTRVRSVVPFVKKNKETIWMDIDISPVYENNNLKYFIAIQYDITKLKLAQDELRESEQHFRAFGEASTEAMMIYNNSEMLNWNPKLSEMTGYHNVEISKMNPIDFFHPLERQRVLERSQENKPTHYETHFLTKKGEIKEVAINAQPVEWDNKQARIRVIRDITRFKDTEEMAKSARERYKTIVDNTIDLVCCYNTDLEIKFVNQTFCEYFDVELEKIIGMSLLLFIPVEDHSEIKKYAKQISQEYPIIRGLHRVERCGEIRWQDWIDRAIFDKNGSIIEIQSVSRDVTSYTKKDIISKS